MSAAALVALLRRRYGPPAPDAELLRAYADRGDEQAFRRLVERHGPLVLRLCRRLLGDAHSADDAFQATFLTLARRAGAIRHPETLAGWLYGVARRVCANACTARARRRGAEARAWQRTVADPVAELSARELLDALDAELDCLPGRYRLPLLLVYWQGLTHAEAARRLGLTPGALHGCLERGRVKLAQRLTSRGFAPSVVLVAPLAVAAVPHDLLAATAALAADPWSKNLPTAVLALVTAGASTKLLQAVGLTVVLAGASWIGVMTRPSQPAGPPKADTPPTPQTATVKPQPDAPRVDANGDPLPPGALLRLGTVRFRHPNGAHALALSPDGAVVATQGSGNVRVWDAATGKSLNRFPYRRRSDGYFVGQHVLAFTPDGRSLIGGVEAAVAVWDLATGAERSIPLGGDTMVQSVHPSPDGLRLAVGTNRGIVVVDWLTGREVYRIDGPAAQANPRNDRLLWEGPHNLALFAPDGGTLAVAADVPNVIRLCEPGTGAERQRLELAGQLVRLTFTRDSRYLAATERDNAVRVYEVATGRRVHAWTVTLTNPFENATLAIAVSADGNTLAAGATDALIRLWDLGTGNEVRTLRGHGWYVTGLAFAPDGRMLYSTSYDGTVRRWDVASGQEKPLENAATGVVARSPDGAVLATEAANGAIDLWNAARGVRLRTLAGNPAGFVRLEFSPNGAVLAASGNDLSIQLWDVATGRLRRQWSWPKGKDPHTEANDLAFSPDGRILATAVFRANAALLWDTTTGEQLGQLEHEMVRSVAFTPDGRTLISGGWDKYLRRWDVAGRVARDVQLVSDTADVPGGLPDDPRVECVALSPDGRLMATLHVNGTILIWDGTTGRLLNKYRGWKDQGRLLAFAPDGQWLITEGDSSGSVCLREPLTGQPALQLRGHEGRLFFLDFRGDGRTAISGSADNTALLWGLRPPVPAGAAKDLPALWADLAGPDAPTAYQAVWALADRSAESVPFLKDKLAPAEPVDAARLRQWLDDLDSSTFAVRDAASKELVRVADRIEEALRQAWADAPSAEKQRRLEAMLDHLDPIRSPEQVRRARAVTALEWAATPPARQLLEALAQGAPTARLTRDAKASLERLNRRADTPPK